MKLYPFDLFLAKLVPVFLYVINLTLVSLATKVLALTVWEVNLETGAVVIPKTRNPPNKANARAMFAAISRS